MNNEDQKKTGWKQKLAHEFYEYWFNFIYLAVFFGAFAWYRRLVLAEYQIAYLHYGIALLKALVLAKVILIVDAFRVGRKFEDKPLIFSTLYQALIFTLCVVLFDILERIIGGLLHGKGVAGGFADFLNQGLDALLAGCLVTFCAFVPFFAFRELGRVLGDLRIRDLFFRKRSGEGMRAG